MKYIVVPKDVHIVDRRGKPVKAPEFVDGQDEQQLVDVVISHEKFVIGQLLAHPHLVKGGGEALRRVVKLQKLFDGCQEGDVVAVEDADYRAVRPVLDMLEWSPAFAPFAPQMLPHIEAWESAEKQGDDWKKERDAEARKAGAEVISIKSPDVA